MLLASFRYTHLCFCLLFLKLFKNPILPILHFGIFIFFHSTKNLVMELRLEQDQKKKSLESRKNP